MTITVSNRIIAVSSALVVGLVSILVLVWTPNDISAKSKVEQLQEPLAQLNSQSNYLAAYLRTYRDGSSSQPLDSTYADKLKKQDSDFDAAMGATATVISEMQAQEGRLISLRAKNEIKHSIEDYRSQIDYTKKGDATIIGYFLFVHSALWQKAPDTLAGDQSQLEYYREEKHYLDKYKGLSGEPCPNLTAVNAANLAFANDEISYKNTESGNIGRLNSLNDDMVAQLAIVKRITDIFDNALPK